MDKNLGVSSVSFLNRMKILNQLISIETNIKNTGLNNLANIPIELSFNNQRVGQVITDFKPDLGVISFSGISNKRWNFRKRYLFRR